MAEQLTARKGPACRGLSECRARQQLLARAALAGEEHRRARARRSPDQIENLRHARAVRHDRESFLLERVPQAPQLLLEPLLAQGAFDRRQKLLDPERLGQVVVGARLDRLDGRVDAPERGDDYDRHVAVGGVQLRQQVGAPHLGHHQIGDHHVQGDGGRAFERLPPAGGAENDVAPLAQLLLEIRPHLVVVLNDQQGAVGCHDAATRWAAPVAGRASGRYTVSRVPRPISLSMSIQPPCSRTMP